MTELNLTACLQVAGVVNRNGNIYTEEALRAAAKHDPRLEIVENEGRIELWIRVKKMLEASDDRLLHGDDASSCGC